MKKSFYSFRFQIGLTAELIRTYQPIIVEINDLLYYFWWLVVVLLLYFCCVYHCFHSGFNSLIKPNYFKMS